MSVIRVNHKSIGISFSSRGEAEVMVWAPNAKSVSIVMPERGQRVLLSPNDRGYFSHIGGDIQPGDLYQFELDGETFPDPASQFQPQGIFGPSQVMNLNQFNWTDESWKNPSLPDYIIYELHTGTFTASGTFNGIEEKLSYLKDLGVTAIEIMPVAEFSGKRNWGYDGVLPFAVHHAYGGPAALQRLVDECHKHGLAVILDVVYNHMGPEGNYLGSFGPYFTDKYKTPWGSAVNFDDGGSDEVRRYFIENVLMWFRDYHIDALRLDAVHAIRDFSPVHILREIRDFTDQLMRDTGRVHYLIAECDLNDPRYISDVASNGLGMDAQWMDEFHHALRVSSGNERIGYYSDFDGILHLAKSYRDAYVYDGQYSAHRGKTFGVKADGLSGDKFVVFSQNHDQVGNRMLGERASVLVGFEMQKVMAAAVLISPYLPLLFMGEEYGETNPFLYFVNHSDPKLIEAVREGRKKEFSSFHRGEEVPDPQSEETFIASKLDWPKLENKLHQSMFAFYRELIRLRKKLRSLSAGDRTNVEVTVLHDKMLIVNRSVEGQRVSCFLNFSKDSLPLEGYLTDSTLRICMDSADRKWGGPGRENSDTVAPESFILFTNQNV